MNKLRQHNLDWIWDVKVLIVSSSGLEKHKDQDAEALLLLADVGPNLL